jgi:hypothetical protein
MRLTTKLVETVAELSASLVALSYIIETIFLDGGKPSVLLAGVWLIVAYLAGISKKLSKD